MGLIQPRALSPFELAAGRRNALRSTGPRAGKALASLNALKHRLARPLVPQGRVRTKRDYHQSQNVLQSQ